MIGHLSIGVQHFHVKLLFQENFKKNSYNYVHKTNGLKRLMLVYSAYSVIQTS